MSLPFDLDNSEEDGSDEGFQDADESDDESDEDGRGWSFSR